MWERVCRFFTNAMVELPLSLKSSLNKDWYGASEALEVIAIEPFDIPETASTINNINGELQCNNTNFLSN